MKALLLAAGLGTRLRPLTYSIPKCLVPIKNKPLLAYWLELLSDSSISEIIINTHYLPHLVRDFILHSPWKKKVKLVYEPTLLGTAGTILNNHQLLSDGAFLLAHADNLTRFDVSAFKETHQKRRPNIEITMMTFETDQPENCGIVELNEYNAVIGFEEKPAKPRSRLANAAVYILQPSIINFLLSLNRSIIDMSTEVLPHYINRIQTFHNIDYHRDIGTSTSLRIAETDFHE